MRSQPTRVNYQEFEPAQLDLIRPLWEQLKAHHLPLNPQLAPGRAARTFEARKQELLAKSGCGFLRIELAYTGAQPSPIGYCIATLSSTGTGEIDSICVAPEYRGQGVGTELTRRALAWLDGKNARSKLVVVASGNDAALGFYTRFGFVPDCISLRQVPTEQCHPIANRPPDAKV